MDSTLHVRWIRFTDSSPSERRDGLLAYVHVAFDAFTADSITVRKTRDARLVVSYPSRPSKHSKKGHPIFLPTDPAVRKALEKEILDLYRRHQEGRP